MRWAPATVGHRRPLAALGLAQHRRRSSRGHRAWSLTGRCACGMRMGGRACLCWRVTSHGRMYCRPVNTQASNVRMPRVSWEPVCLHMLPCASFLPQAPSPSSPASPADILPAAGFLQQYACSTGHRDSQQQQHEGSAGVGGSTLLTPATQQTIRRVVALGGTAARPQSSIRRLQPTTDVHRLEVSCAGCPT